MSEQRTAEPRRGREGGRWLNQRPSSEDFAEWFKVSMKLDPKLSHEDYIGGVVLIPAVDERARQVTGFTAQGAPIIEQIPELSYNPYAKVEARIAYYWDLLAVHEEWAAEIEHVASERVPLDFVTEEERREHDNASFSNFKRRQPSAMTALVHQLPKGYSIMSVPVGSGYSHFLCCTVRVSIFDRSEMGKRREERVPIRTGRGTKQVPLLMGRQQPYADPNSLMKAETGALGRALGFAGIFVIPGGGVATAEDMLESMAQGATAAQDPAEGNQGPAAPAEVPVRTGAEQQADDEQQLRTRAITLYRQLSEEAPGKAEAFGEWMRVRRLTSFGDAGGAALRGAVKKLEKLKDEHDHPDESQPQETPDVPAQAAEQEPSGTDE